MASKGAQPDPPPRSPDSHSSSNISGIPQSIISDARRTVKEPFVPAKHVRFEPPMKILSMEELGFGSGKGISPNAVSEPFRLFSDSAIEQMRAEVFSEQVLSKYHATSAFAANQVRGAGAKLAPFIHNAWNSPEVLAAVSQVAGVDLIPVFDLHTGHCNISVRPDGYEPSAEDQEENITAFGWHEDCFPFVCVLMLSDCTDMVGGETMLKTGNGDFLKVRGPTMGTAVVMQGRYIEHQALKARGGRERISMVTSFRPRDPHAKDESFLGGVRKISHVPTLYQRYTEYRLENLEERVRSELKSVREQGRSGRDFVYLKTRKWLAEQKAYIESMIAELQDPECC